MGRLLQERVQYVLTLFVLLLFSSASVFGATISTGATTGVWAGNNITASGTDVINVNEIVTRLATGNVTINVTGDVTIANGIAAHNATPYLLTINATGNILVSQAIDLSGSNGSGATTAAAAGKNGNSIVLNSTGGSVTVNSQILTNGGDGGNPSSGSQDGGAGGNGGSITITAATDVIISQSINSTGHQGGQPNGNNGGGAGGNGGDVSIIAGGIVNMTGDIIVSGGLARDGNNLKSGLPGVPGNVSITGQGNISLWVITANAGNAGKCTQCSDTPAGGNASAKTINIASTAGSVTVNRAITSNGGNGAQQANGQKSTNGGNGGNVTITAASGITVDAAGQIRVAGGTVPDANGGPSNTGNGGAGGNITLAATSTTSTISVAGALYANGANGGKAGSNGGNIAGAGGAGGHININSCCAALVSREITAQGGNGGDGNGKVRGDGGAGGYIKFNNVGTVNGKDDLSQITFSNTVNAAPGAIGGNGSGGTAGTQANTGNYGTASNGVSITISPSACAAPLAPITITEVSRTCNSISINWNAVADANTYELYRCASAGICTNLIHTETGAGSHTYTDNGLSSGVTYYYTVKATETATGRFSESDVKTIATTAQPLPTLSGTPDYTAVALTYTTPGTATGFTLYRCTSETGGCTALTTSGTSFNDTGLDEGKTYYYKIVANFAGGCTSEKIVSVKTLANIAYPDPYNCTASACNDLVGYVNFANKNGVETGRWSINDVDFYGAIGADNQRLTTSSTYQGTGDLYTNGNYFIVKNPNTEKGGNSAASVEYMRNVDALGGVFTARGSSNNNMLVYQIRGLNSSATSSVAKKTYCVRVKMRNIGVPTHTDGNDYNNPCAENGNNIRVDLLKLDNAEAGGVFPNNLTNMAFTTDDPYGTWTTTNIDCSTSASGNWKRNDQQSTMTRYGDLTVFVGQITIPTAQNGSIDDGFKIQIRGIGAGRNTITGVESIEVYGCLPKTIVATDEENKTIIGNVFCENGPVKLTATGAGFGGNIKWYKGTSYADAINTAPIGAGNVFNTVAPWGVGSSELYIAVGDLGFDTIRITSRFCCSSLGQSAVIHQEYFNTGGVGGVTYETTGCGNGIYADLPGIGTINFISNNYLYAGSAAGCVASGGGANDGEYAVVKNAQNAGYWGQFYDHTSGDGSSGMLLVNAATSSGDDYFYKHSLTGLCDNTKYEFSAWYASICPTCPAKVNIDFEIWQDDAGGNPVGLVPIEHFLTGNVNDGIWHNALIQFNTPESGGTGKYTLKIRNNTNTTENSGNDVVLDDIVVTKCVPNMYTYEEGTSNVSTSVCSDNPVSLEIPLPVSVREVVTGGNLALPIYIQWMKTQTPAVESSWVPVGDPTTNNVYSVIPPGINEVIYYRAKITIDSTRAANIGALLSGNCFNDVISQNFTLQQTGDLQIQTEPDVAEFYICDGDLIGGYDLTGSAPDDADGWNWIKGNMGVQYDTLGMVLSTNETDKVIRVTEAGTYYFVVKRGTCRADKSVTVGEAQTPILNPAEISAPPAICDGGTLTLTPPQVISNVDITNQGWLLNDALFDISRVFTYADNGKTLKYFAVNCADSLVSNAVTITVNPKPTVTLTVPTTDVCPGSTVNVSAAVTSGTPAYTYTWTGATQVNAANTSLTASANCNTTMEVSVSVSDSKSCVGTDSKTFTVRDVTAPTGTAPAGTNNINSCFVDASTVPAGVPAFVPATVAGNYTDACGAVTATLTNTAISGDNCSWSVVYTYEVSDACGNKLTGQIITHTGGDKTAPTGTAPAGTNNINSCFVDASTVPAGVPAFVPATVAGNYTDACGTVTATLTNTAISGDNCSWSVVYTYEVSDACGNKLTGQIITHTGGDKTNPVITTANLPTDSVAVVTGTCTFAVPDFTNRVKNQSSDNCTAQGLLMVTQIPTAGTTITANTNVTITVKDVCNNESTYTISVTIPTAPTLTIANPSAFCKGESYDLEDAVTEYTNGTLAFYTGTGKVGLLSESTVTPDNTTIYYAVVTNTATGCSIEKAITITVNALPTAGITNNDETTELTCTITSISVTATGGTTYQWSGGTTPTTAANALNSAGVYTVIVIDNNGCKDTTEIEITQDDEMPSVEIQADNTTLTCNLTSISLITEVEGEIVSYAWTGQKTGSASTMTADAAGTYTVTVTADNGCTASDEIVIGQNVTQPVPGITADRAGITCDTTSITLSGSPTSDVTYLWSTGATSPTINVNSAGNYKLVVTSTLSGCKDSVTYVVT
ncbi:MAG: fibronectin type III domain-containing protein, partial [Prevotellaceae bacterium]|nr:fibronectin type III domain-containing protein [Prevotellaceae bacterium]